MSTPAPDKPAEPETVSPCCNANVSIFSGDDREGTQFYVCNKCRQPCDPIPRKKPAAPTPVKPEPAPPTVADGTTPRTDAHSQIVKESTDGYCVDMATADFARTLERELSQALREIERLGAEIADRKLITEDHHDQLAQYEEIVTGLRGLNRRNDAIIADLTAQLTAANAALAEAKELNANHVSMHQWSKERITELDAELARWNRKYKAAMKQSTPDAPKG